VIINKLIRVVSQKEVWGWVNSNSKGVAVRRDLRGVVVRAEMFGQLTSGLETAWNKLKGEGFPNFTRIKDLLHCLDCC